MKTDTSLDLEYVSWFYLKQNTSVKTTENWRKTT